MTSEINRVCVLLSTFNGELYLEEQLSSLANQTYSEFDVIARDDGSSDDTISILQSAGIEVVNGDKNIGPQRSFTALINLALERNKYDFFLFCDQDDIWAPNKIEILLKGIHNASPKHTPTLIFSDLIVVDADNKPISKSFLKHQKLNPKRTQLNQLLMQNVVTGCSCLFNKELAILAKRMTDDVLMHDWGVAIIASLFGKIVFCEDALVRYRQHSNNTLGAKKHTVSAYLPLLKKILNGAHQPLKHNIIQAKFFLNTYGKEINNDKFKILNAFISLTNANRFYFLRKLLEFGFFKSSYSRNLVLFASTLFNHKKN